MTEEELGKLILAYHVGLFVLSLPAMYAILGESFVSKGHQKAEDICAHARGDLSEELIDKIKPLIESETANVQLYGSDDSPLDSASVSTPNRVDSEGFKDAMLEFLEANSPRFDRYWIAFRCKRSLGTTRRCLRTTVTLWSSAAVVGIIIFGGAKLEIWSHPPSTWTILITVFTSIPLVVLVLSTVIYATITNRLDGAQP